MPLNSEKYLTKNPISEAFENTISEAGVMPIEGGVVVSGKVVPEEGICKPRHRGKKAGSRRNSDSRIPESDSRGLRVGKGSECPESLGDALT